MSSNSCTKCLIFSFNLLALIAGLGIIATGAVVYKDTPFSFFDGVEDIVQRNLPHIYKGTAISVMVFGSVVSLLAFLGCAGAICENKCLLKTFVAILTFFLVVQLILVGTFLVLIETNHLDLKTDIGNIINETKSDHPETACDVFKDLSKNKICCEPFHTINCTVTCKPESKNCVTGLYDTFTHYSKIAGFVVIGMCAIELLAVLFACCFMRSIESEKVEPYNYPRSPYY